MRQLGQMALNAGIIDSGVALRMCNRQRVCKRVWRKRRGSAAVTGSTRQRTISFSDAAFGAAQLFEGALRYWYRQGAIQRWKDPHAVGANKQRRGVYRWWRPREENVRR